MVSSKNKNKVLTIIILLTIIGSLESILLAGYLSIIITHMASQDFSSVFVITIIFSILISILFIIKLVNTYFINSFIGYQLLDLKNSLVASFFYSPNIKTNEKGSKNFLTYMTTDMKYLEDNYYLLMLQQLSNATKFIFSLVMSLILGWQATVVMVFITVISLFFPRLFHYRLKRLSSSWSQNSSHYTNLIKDSINGYETINNFDIEPLIVSNLGEANKQLEKSNIILKFVTNLVEFLTYYINHIAMTFTVLISSYLVYKNLMPVGNVIGIIQLSNSIVFPIVSLIQNKTKMTSSKPILKKIMFFAQNMNSTDKTQFIGQHMHISIEVSHLSYSINDKVILKDISFEIPSKQKLLIVGKSGAGKSTLLKIIQNKIPNQPAGVKIIDQQTGNILDSSVIDRIEQAPYLYNETLLFNLSLGVEYSESVLKRACELACLTDFVAEKGLDYIIENNGTNLSGGQKQRIEIARVILRNKKIIFMDEGTSSLDYETAQIIENYFLSSEELTFVSISHRLSKDILSKFDKVMTLNDGKIF